MVDTELAQRIDNLITFLSTSGRRRGVLFKKRSSPFDLSAFEGAEPAIGSIVDSVDGVGFAFPDGDIARCKDVIDCVDRVDHSYLYDSFTHSDGRTLRGLFASKGTVRNEDIAFSAIRVRMVPMSAMRWKQGWKRSAGRPIVLHSRMCEVTSAAILSNGTYEIITFYDDPNAAFARDAAASCLAKRYQWRVSLGYEGCVSLSFSTDPIGVREVFRLRDIPNGACRRAALLHWVSEHWRKRRSDPAEEMRVRAHLRGATEFTWNGLRCGIKPSDYETDRLSEGRAP